ncbi:MAG: hypothetical protein L6U99_05905 [Clostridium sp.]|nr:MAG: hypothetical protein L6U99_05905 [Clostridium sp.]
MLFLIGGKKMEQERHLFLRGIKFGLFGSFALGLKNNTDTYIKRNKKSLINNKKQV